MSDVVDVYKIVNGMGVLVSSSARLSSECYGLTGLSLPSTVAFVGGACVTLKIIFVLMIRFV